MAQLILKRLQFLRAFEEENPSREKALALLSETIASDQNTQ